MKKIMAKNKSIKTFEAIPPHIEDLLKKCPALAEAAQYGVDIGLLLDNLQRPVSQRIRRHQAALNAMNQLRRVGRNEK
jgi:hypothetical protein